jgi:hypothetical protein
MANKSKFYDKFGEFLKQMEKTFIDKDADYAGPRGPFGNFKECETIGLPAYVGCYVRMMDKITRLNNLILFDPKIKDEKIHDTAMDLANYSVVFRILLDESDPELCEIWEEHKERVRKLFEQRSNNEEEKE